MVGLGDFCFSTAAGEKHGDDYSYESGIKRTADFEVKGF